MAVAAALAPTPPATPAGPRFVTYAEVQERLGHVPDSRVRVYPLPGTATEQDLLNPALAGEGGCELVDGILVEKPMGWREGWLGLWIGTLLNQFLMEHNLGLVAGPDGMIRFKMDLVRLPDLSFVSWDRVEHPEELENPAGACLELAPDLVVEVLSPGNTPREMAIKLREYAKAGVKLVWYVDPERKEVDVYPKGNPRRKKTVGVGGAIDGGAVLPGLSLPVAKIFEKRAPARKSGKGAGRKPKS